MTKKNWEEEFDEEFVRDDGLMSKYWYNIGEPEYMADVIKSFIKDLIKQKQKEAIKEVKLDRAEEGSPQWTIGWNTAVKNLEAKKQQLIEEIDS